MMNVIKFVTIKKASYDQARRCYCESSAGILFSRRSGGSDALSHLGRRLLATTNGPPHKAEVSGDPLQTSKDYNHASKSASTLQKSKPTRINQRAPPLRRRAPIASLGRSDHPSPLARKSPKSTENGLDTMVDNSFSSIQKLLGLIKEPNIKKSDLSLPRSEKQRAQAASVKPEATLAKESSGLPPTNVDRLDSRLEALFQRSKTASNDFESAKYDDWALSPAPALVGMDDKSHQKYGDRDKEMVEEYIRMVESTITEERFGRRHTAHPVKEEDIAPVVAWLRLLEPSLTVEGPIWSHAMESGQVPSDEDAKTKFTQEVLAQQKLFMENMQWSEKQYEVANGAIYHIANLCARDGTAKPLAIMWQKIREAGIKNQKVLHRLLYVSSTFGTNNRSKQAAYSRVTGISILDVLRADPLPPMPSAGDASSEQEAVDEAGTTSMVDITDEIAMYHDMLHEPTEQSINVRIRLLVAQGHAQLAEQLIEQHLGQAEVRLRACTPVLRLYLEQGQVAAALKLYKRMREMPQVILDAETFIHILASLAEQGYFRANALPIEGLTDLGYTASSGPRLFDQIVSEMARETIDISSASAARLYNGLAEGFPDSNLLKANMLEPLKVASHPAGDNEVIASRVYVDPLTGVCSRSGVALRLIELGDADKEKLRDSLLTISRNEQVEQQEKVKAVKSYNETVRADDELMSFFRWMDRRNGEPFTAIVDGANVGYYFQNFESGRFSFHQIKFVVDALESLGERPLVILPTKYTRSSFAITIGAGGAGASKKQNVTDEEASICRDLITSGKVAIVGRGLLDDYFWILASVSPQTASRNGRSIHVEPGNEDGRWPGTRPILITNDQMRDHSLFMMQPMLFRRWYSNFIVNYNFAPFVDGESFNPEIGFSPADFFSREIQGNALPDGSMVWHFPLRDEEHHWFCVRIPRYMP